MSSSQFWLEIVIYQITSASISFAASVMIVSFIALNGLSTPYRRIIFGLSISDMCQSFGILVGPFLNPSNLPQALWGIGNKHTCRLDGFLNLLGMTAVPMYTVFLCIYYVCKLKSRVSDAQFTQRIEKKMHVAIIAINLGLYLPALGMDVMNPNYLGNLCGPAFLPTGCKQNPELYGECDDSNKPTLTFFLMFSGAVVPVVSLVAILICMGLILWHTVMRERIFGKRKGPVLENDRAHGTVSTVDRTSIMQGSRYERYPTSVDVPANADDGENTASDTNAETLSRLYKKELISQVCCYIMVFCLTNLPYIFVVIMLQTSSRVSNNGLRVNFILYPLAGFFNIIVYTRWNVRSWRRSHPECSWLREFWLVLKAGGDLPSSNEEDDAGDDLSTEDGRPLRVKNRPASISSVQFGGVQATPVYEHICSVAAVNEEISAVKEGDVRYRPESQWFYAKGGSSIVGTSRFDATSNATTIQHANHSHTQRDLSSFADDMSLADLKSWSDNIDSEAGAVSL